jgi:hypothetical protein
LKSIQRQVLLPLYFRSDSFIITFGFEMELLYDTLEVASLDSHHFLCFHTFLSQIPVIMNPYYELILAERKKLMMIEKTIYSIVYEELKATTMTATAVCFSAK